MTSTSSPAPSKSLPLFAVHALVVALLLGYWPSARDLYPDLFRAGVGAVFASGEAPSLAVRPGRLRGDDVTDTFVERLGAPEAEPRWRINLSSIRMGYWPSAVLAALLFATPMPGRRRAWALLVGFVWIGAYALGRLWLEVLRADAELAGGGVAAGRLLPAELLDRVPEARHLVVRRRKKRRNNRKAKRARNPRIRSGLLCITQRTRKTIPRSRQAYSA